MRLLLRLAQVAVLASLASACASPRAEFRPPTPGTVASEVDLEVLAGCPYITFTTGTEMYPDRPSTDNLVSREAVRDVERLFADELAEAGFLEAARPERAAFALVAQLGRSNAAEEAFGVIDFRVTTRIHRDFSIATMDSVFDGSSMYYVGAVQPVRISIDEETIAGGGRLPQVARRFASVSWEKSVGVINALCRWRAGLAEEGLAIEDLREELVREMVEVRGRARLRKQLEIEVQRSP